MPFICRTVLPIATVVLILSGAVYAQEGGGHMLFGDLKVDESKVTGPKPQNYTIVLYRVADSSSGERQNVANGGRYRFLDVRNGEYILVVEVAGVEMARMQFLLQEGRRTEIRRDIELQWQPPVPAGAPGPVGPLTMDVYDRPAGSRPLYEKARQALAAKEYKQAAEVLEQITKADPKDFEAWTELGTARFNQDRMADAEKAYARALENRPAFLLAQLNLGKTALAQKKPEQAVPVLEKATKDHPQSADVHFYLGEAYLQNKRGSKAVGHLNEAIRLDPEGKAEAHLRLAALYNAAGMKDRAAAEYELFLAKKPDHPEKRKMQEYIQSNKK